MNLKDMGRQARKASKQLALASAETKNAALQHMADCLMQAAATILDANQRDAQAAVQSGLSPAMVDRLVLNEARLAGIISDLRSVADLPDPVGEVFEKAVMPSGITAEKRRVPLGVLAVIYEARPNVTVDVAGLALKSGNAVILRGGSETIPTNQALLNALRKGLEKAGIAQDVLQFIDSPDRALVNELLQLDEYVDMVIPRGGAALHAFCRENSRIPVITGGIGICHLFVDESADLDAAALVIQNAKIQRPTVCNALDTVLVHERVAEKFLPDLVRLLVKDGVTFRAEPRAYALAGGDPMVSPAGPDDFSTEWLSLVLGIKVVDGLDEAMEHIAAYSTGHSDGILTGDEENVRQFLNQVDSAAVYVNASTRFTDGGQLGLGAEVAISTQRLHARGPMGLRELTTYKWVIRGDYTVRK